MFVGGCVGGGGVIVRLSLAGKVVEVGMSGIDLAAVGRALRAGAFGP